MLNTKMYTDEIINANLITNFDKKDRPIYEKALKIYKKLTGDNTMFITNDAYIYNGSRSDEMYALRCSKRKVRCKFWAIFDEISNTTKLGRTWRKRWDSYGL